ncbi:MAG: GNAT family N-acetyltransferase [Chloroflexota bacterium]|nr:GNAT family N-acetyltransferase [Chloroflexota bacterium]
MTAATPPLLRRAQRDDAEAITCLTLRSKRHWGYSEAFMTAMTPDLTITSADLRVAADRVEVLEAEGDLLGFFRLQRRTELAFLEDLFIDPPAMGQGYGQRLFLRAADLARGWGLGVMEFESDPFAEPFYLRLGAKRVGMSPSALLPGRSIPLMRYALLG